MKRTKSDHRIPRDEALYHAYKEVLKKHPDISGDEAIRLTLLAPQPRLWISFYGVYRILLRVIRDKRATPRHRARYMLEREVEEKYYRLKRQKMFRHASAYFIASFIIAEPSVGFYVSFLYAKKVIGQVRKEHQKLWKKCIPF